MAYMVAITERLENYDRGYLFSREPMTLTAFISEVNWQVRGGFFRDDYILADKVEGLPGVLKCNIDGKARPVLIERGPYSEECFKEQCLSLWGGEV